ncbi:Hypothetical predicted protein [Xyrichtys novacula]|uniref:Uncharacterized protein n=1 Tax=Xyrichtys novacula TaxID=13765 RepID=A0AAV1G3K2_XYRNO|nr:Hypothetical predicted protein [Xyrichtys novacula]
MSRDGPKPQALTQAAVPKQAAKIHCEEYSCSLSKSAPLGFIAGEHKVLRMELCPTEGPNRQSYDSSSPPKKAVDFNKTIKNLGYQWCVYQNSLTLKEKKKKERERDLKRQTSQKKLKLLSYVNLFRNGCFL